VGEGGGLKTPADKPFARTHDPGFYGLSDLEKSRFMTTTGEWSIFSRAVTATPSRF
jgi:hypothetical protein